jgi:hypothetical protein
MGVHIVSKITVLAVLLVAVLGYLAYDPSAAKSAVNWARRQINGVPQVKDVGSPNYMPITPAKGLE